MCHPDSSSSSHLVTTRCYERVRGLVVQEPAVRKSKNQQLGNLNEECITEKDTVEREVIRECPRLEILYDTK
jgi:hypothetical protein